MRQQTDTTDAKRFMPLFIGNGDKNFSRSTEQARLKAAKPQGFRSALYADACEHYTIVLSKNFL